ncbi:maleylpyruvate isomerase family mycothiol-dependent enzyme [Nocardioides sp. zg-579]|uniref:Maleylpyruvate isomerase family mycothiol-dependent enzyme n=1 Tax=Nocardioides marmotae TaxID=2663857 RepID=A0A6I3JF83_9ACTN|nr:maleylpyruvate isomerase family mycothiol-dependent enzyme [Nocardioides marmotae]MCR6033129.1 maleylpyruvate isomerase family mycothiol-dependent enzyme [Gordonia jinghuaiqii]MTB96781.1 maleylpyruvate isomerase family mycothiol-dependent enzyme [Nocardioides marmotae]QKE03015.1 maleylpyruvate isomerase family mycothiol-dependent enzyme [Nocardioides marmotae]
MSDQERLAGYVEVWWRAVDDLTALLEQLPEEDWSRPTDLEGWDVRAVVAHVAHLERVLATGEEEHAEIGDPAPAHVRSMLGHYTEIGPANRRTATPDELIIEIRAAATARHTALLADPPTDAAAKPERIFAGVPWSWETLLRNRPLDVWMHEQDVRRAVGRPGGMDSPAAQHVADYLLEAMGFVLAKRVGAPAGTTLLVAVDGSAPIAFTVTEQGRGERLPAAPAEPTATLRMDRETFVVLAGGRRPEAAASVVVEGDRALAQQVLAQMATTP